MATDRAALERAIECVLEGLPYGRDLPNSNLGRVVAAARAHLDTLPRTKMVEVKRWVAFDHEDESRGTDEDGHLILNLRAYTVEPGGGRHGQWVTFKIEVPA